MNIRQRIDIKVKFLLHETSAPVKFRPPLWFTIDIRDFYSIKNIGEGYEMGDWLIYEVNNDRIRAQHKHKELYEAIYLRHNIN